MTSFYLDPGGTEAMADLLAQHAATVLAALPTPPTSCDTEVDEAVRAVVQLASARVRTAGTALAGQARSARSAIRLYQLTDRKLATQTRLVEQRA